jgi:hypothetical protein
MLKIYLIYLYERRIILCLTLEDGTDRLSLNVGKKNYHSRLLKTPKKAQISLQ